MSQEEKIPVLLEDIYVPDQIICSITLEPITDFYGVTEIGSIYGYAAILQWQRLNKQNIIDPLTGERITQALTKCSSIQEAKIESAYQKKSGPKQKSQNLVVDGALLTTIALKLPSCESFWIHLKLHQRGWLTKSRNSDNSGKELM